jgi:hypothetical protein
MLAILLLALLAVSPIHVTSLTPQHSPCLSLEFEAPPLFEQCMLAWDQVKGDNTLCDSVGFDGNFKSFTIESILDDLDLLDPEGFYSSLARACGENPIPETRQLIDILGSNLGCCSMSIDFVILGGPDIANCLSSEYYFTAKSAFNHNLSKIHCRAHDYCLGDNALWPSLTCEYRENCDLVLADAMLYGKDLCNRWAKGWGSCIAAIPLVYAAMLTTPNAC